MIQAGPHIAGLFLVCTLAGCQSGESPRVPVRENSPTAVSYLERSNRALKESAFTAALAFVDSAHTVQPGWADAYFLEGRIRFEQGLIEQAGTAFLRVQQLDPDYPGLDHNLGNVKYREGRYRESVKRYVQAARSSSDARSWHAAGAAYERLGVIDSARWALGNALEVDPDNAAALDQLAQLLQGDGRTIEAIAYAERAAALDPSSPAYTYGLAMLYLALDRADEAVGPLLKLTEERPWDYAALNGLGRALRMTGRQAESARTLLRADSLRRVMSEVERKEQAARNLPGSFINQVEYAEALRKHGRLADAIRVYQRARALRPQDTSLQNNLATLMQQSGQTEEAIALYRDLLSRDASFIEGWLNLSVIYLRQGDRERGEEYWSKARQLNPEHPIVRRLEEAFR